MNKFCVAIFAALFLISQPAKAQDVVLTSRDGKVEISGSLLGFDGEFYRVDTIFGELTVDGTGVLCSGPACPSLTDYVAEISVSGAFSMAEVLMPALLEAFAMRNGYEVSREAVDGARFIYHLTEESDSTNLARFHFHASNSDEGFADLLADEADIAMSLREIRPDEAKRGYEAGLGDMRKANRSRVLALDGLVAVVSPGSPVRAVSLLELAKIYSGEIKNWEELGGPNAPIALHLLNAGSGITQAIEDALMKPAGRAFAGDVVRHERNIDLVSGVMRDPFAIGIARFSEVGSTQVLSFKGACGFSMSASRRTIKTEDYPLTAPMFLYVPARRLPKIAREFLAFTRSPSAQVVIRRAGFVDQAPEEVSVNLQGNRFTNAVKVAEDEAGLETLKRMVNVLAPMKRLTTSFRFRLGSAELDAQSQSNVQQLSRALEAGAYDEKSIVFVGFSDGDGPAEANLRIARKRAQAVRRAVLQAAETANFDRLSLEVEAFGEAMPMACDDTEWGRQVNRRVEIWLR